VSEKNRRLVLAQRPTGLVDESTTRLEHEELPELQDGEALVKVRYLSIDPTIRTWMDDAPGYLPPIGIDDVIRSGGIGEVLESRSEAYQPGQLVYGVTGWQEHVIADSGERAMQPLPPGVEPTKALGILGVTGMTAYFGMTDVGRVAEGDVVVVSGAAGATGSTAGQIARIKGAKKVVGIAGGPEKCALLTDELGFDAAIDYRGDDVKGALRAATPDRVDVYFDNVGGDILDLALTRLNMKARVVICGAISQYNNESSMRGPSNYMALLVSRARMEGFVVFDYAKRYREAAAEIAGWIAEGKVATKEHVVKGGIDDFPETLQMLFRGENVGKLVLELA
jgi:hypothetical protein